jgi:hypothetical protein
VLGHAYDVGSFANSVAIGDLNGDAKPDLAAACAGSGWGPACVSVLLGHGDGTFGSRTDYGIGYATAPCSIVIEDFNHDFKPDLAVANRDAASVSVLFNLSPDWPTATLLSLFEGRWTNQGVELRWRFSEPARFTNTRIERGGALDGPWRIIPGERHDADGTCVLVDRDAVAGATYYYRLIATGPDGREATFAPLAVAAGNRPVAFELLPVAPNPGHDRVSIAFTVANETSVRLRVLDLQGRQVALLADETRKAGRYQVSWDGRTVAGRVPSGIYLVSYEAAGQRWVRRFALVD